MKILIYQDIWSKRISRVRSLDSNWMELLQAESEYLLDCDEDSYLILKPLPPDPELGRILPEHSVSFENNLCPVIVQDSEGVVLMQAFANPEALALTIRDGYAHFYSRSRNKLWKKGEESGHVQEVSIIEYSPLYKYLVYRVSQTKGACHTGYYSCFYRRHTGIGEGLVYSKKSFEPESVYAG